MQKIANQANAIVYVNFFEKWKTLIHLDARAVQRAQSGAKGQVFYEVHPTKRIWSPQTNA